MDLDDLHRMKLESLQKGLFVSEETSFVHKKFYYDESGNDSCVGITNTGTLNLTNPFSIFVLGGVVADDSLSCDDLKNVLGLTGKNEIKSTKILKGTLCKVLDKEVTSKLIHLIDDRKWILHFSIIQPLYFSFVDIIDSIGFNPVQHYLLKGALYVVLRSDLDASVRLLRSFGYPNIVARRKDEFVGSIKECVNRYLDNHNNDKQVQNLKLWLSSAVPEDLPFLSGEKTNEWIENYVQFYLDPIVSYPESVHIFDDNTTIRCKLQTRNLTFKGKSVEWKMINSDSCAMVQVCDLLASLIRKFIMSLDELPPDASFNPEEEVGKLSDVGKRNLRQLLYLLSKWTIMNPLLLQRILPSGLNERLNKVYDVLMS